MRAAIVVALVLALSPATATGAPTDCCRVVRVPVWLAPRIYQYDPPGSTIYIY